MSENKPIPYGTKNEVAIKPERGVQVTVQVSRDLFKEAAKNLGKRN